MTESSTNSLTPQSARRFSRRDNLLTRAECSALRGIAIIGIFLHNFCHWLRPVVKENEYLFNIKNCNRMWYELTHPDCLLPVHIVSFLGHYGVPLFLFLSAYGLTMKYESDKNNEAVNSKISFFPFVKNHYLKLFRMMIIGYAAFIFIDCMTPNTYHYTVGKILGMLTMTVNISIGPDANIWPGPYWFFGLMVQLYIIYRLLMYRRGWKITVALMVACWLIQAVCNPISTPLLHFRYNFIGSMVPFGLGLLYARYGHDMSRATYGMTMIVSLLLIFAFSFWYHTWYFVPVFVITFSISLVKLLPTAINGILEWVGAVSAALFVCHPITRKVIIHVSHEGNIYTGILLYIIASLMLAWLFQQIISKMNSNSKKK